MLLLLTLLIIVYLIGFGILLTQTLHFNYKLMLWLFSPILLFVIIGVFIGVGLESIEYDHDA